MNWLKFSLSTKIRRSRNFALELLNSEGAQILTRSQLEAKSVDYFTKVFEAPPRPHVILW